MNNGKYKVCYDYRKRTKGGFVDALLLGSIIIITGTFLLLYLVRGV